MNDTDNTNDNTGLNSLNEVIEEIKNRDNMYQRNLTHEIAIYSFFKNGLFSKIGNEDWLVQFDDNNRLMLSSTNTSIDLSKSLLSEETKLDNRTLVFDDQFEPGAFIIKNSMVIRQDTSIGAICTRTTTVNANEIINRDYEANDQHRFRTMIQCSDDDRNIAFQYTFAHFIADKTQRMCIGVSSDKVLSALNGICFTYHNINFLVYYYSTHINSPTKYFVIEALDILTYEEHINASNKILYAIGFFTTIYPFGPYMIFDCTSDQVRLVAYKRCFDKPRNAKYTMLTLNPYAYYLDRDIHDFIIKKQDNGTVLQRVPLSVENELKPIEKRHFEQLLVLLDNKKFSDMFYTFQEVSTTVSGESYSSHMVCLMLYAVCLEAAANWFHSVYKQDSTAKRSLLSDKAKKEIREEFLSILDRYTDENSDDITKIKNKINGWLFSMPNADNLSAPFDFFDIELSDGDSFLLNLRNKILHGTDVLESKFDLENVLPYLLQAEQYCFGFHSLIWRLIMKAIGYEGVYRDEAKMLEKQTADQSNGGEPFVKKI